MARKVCAACKRLNAGSATACSGCGQAFDPSSVVPASRPKTRRCPQCKVENPALLETCGCGHVVEEVRELREQLEDRVRVGWSLVVLGLLGLAACTGLMLATSAKFVLLWTGGAVVVARGVMTRREAKAALQEMRRAAGELPAAKVVR